MRGAAITLPLARNPRAKMLNMREGFVKLFSHRASGLVIGGVVVAPRASELIHPMTLAVTHRLTTDQTAETVDGLPVDVRHDRRGRPHTAPPDRRLIRSAAPGGGRGAASARSGAQEQSDHERGD